MSAIATCYVASKTRFAPLWRECREVWGELGLRVVSTWIDEAGEGETDDFSRLWLECIWQSRTADFLVAVHENGDVWKGAFLEIGSALASGKPVYVIGRPPGTWIHHPLVTLAESVDDALEDYRARFLCREWSAS